MTFRRILVTAALPYANGDIHLGHLAGAYLPADMYVRYQRLKGREVVFICGSDEHGVPITVSAEQEGVSPKTIVDRFHQRNMEAFGAFGMSFDNYSRTSLPLHHRTAQTFFHDFFERDLLREKKEMQLYCETDSMFLADRYVEGTCPTCKYPQARGDQCENCGSWLNQTDLIDPKCKICGSTPVARETSHWYFPLGDYQKRLEKYIQERDQRDGWKANVLRYCESWFKEGLQDRAVTRDLSWGVPVPVKGYENKVLYVWFDAVLGYISSSREWAEHRGAPESWRDFWLKPDTKYVAFIGKDNVVFHCIVFPAMLMAWNDGNQDQYVLPENVPANEFLNFEGKKFSKSRGWGIDVRDFLRFFPSDYLRYTLAINLPENRDSDFYVRDFQARTNNELADIFGNFAHRTLTFCGKHYGGKVPAMGKLQKADKEMKKTIAEAPAVVGRLYEQYRFRESVIEGMNLARAANKYFNDSEPWKSISSDPDRCATAVHICLQTLRTLSVVLDPVVHKTTSRLREMLGLPAEQINEGWDSAGEFLLEAGHALGNNDVLVRKIDDKEIDALNSFLNEGSMEDSSKTAAQKKITIEDFKNVELKVAKVIEAEKVPKSKKLVRISIDLGGETRQIVAGIGHEYDAAELVGKSIVVVANLESATLMGIESQGMLLAAHNQDGKLSIVTLDRSIEAGSSIR